jgi:hypothetical protein
MNFLTIIPTLLGVLGDLPKVVNALQTLMKLVKDAEATGLDGATKLTNVLNDFETVLNVLNPTWGGTFETVAKEVENVVNEVVAFYNEFAKASPVKTAPANGVATAAGLG